MDRFWTNLESFSIISAFWNNYFSFQLFQPSNFQFFQPSGTSHSLSYEVSLLMHVRITPDIQMNKEMLVSDCIKFERWFLERSIALQFYGINYSVSHKIEIIDFLKNPVHIVQLHAQSHAHVFRMFIYFNFMGQIKKCCNTIER